MVVMKFYSIVSVDFSNNIKHVCFFSQIKTFERKNEIHYVAKMVSFMLAFGILF